ncbi:hypothetical protein BGX24_002305 [Mortierella sp. AD032]|nr:hypothetical protein BGX24_002305 [Mortierella sp. AD032]
MSTNDKPTVLIVEGVGGVMLVASLKDPMFLTPFERCQALGIDDIGPTLAPNLQQLGIYDYWLAIGKDMADSFGYMESLKSCLPKIIVHSKGNKCFAPLRITSCGETRSFPVPPVFGENLTMGAVTAMHDAIALANLIYAMPKEASQDIIRIFEERHKERPPPQAAMGSSKIRQL